ncbi:MAG TPA: 6-phosphogluconolactonase [Verrucomicrobiales bacterium]|nr:6-phosphogluconolactonase [Verrucomicrobiales bacterium]
MRVAIHPNAAAANEAAAELFSGWLTASGVRNVMLAGGNTPLDLYRRIGERCLSLRHLNVFALDEYAGVDGDEARNCANLIRRTAVEPWGVPAERYHCLSSTEAGAVASLRQHEQRIAAAGGVDAAVLGLGGNGHLGFNEPGSAEDSRARVVDLDPVSIEANRAWFSCRYAPSRGATLGLRTILAARRIVLLAYGVHKAAAVKAMLEGPRSPECPASLLQGHSGANVFLDSAAASMMER